MIDGSQDSAFGRSLGLVEQALTLTNLDGDHAAGLSGQTVFLDTGSNALVGSRTEFYYLMLTLDQPLAGGKLGIAAKDGVSVTDTGSSQTIYVDGIEVGIVVPTFPSSEKIRVLFSAKAKQEHVQKLLHAMIYTFPDSGSTAGWSGKVSVHLSDNDSNQVSATVSLALLPGGSSARIVLSQTGIQELAANNTVIGTLAAFDPKAGGIFSFTLLDDAGGRFSLDASGTKLVVANGSLLDYERAQSHTIRVKANGQDGLSYEETLTITVGDVMERVPGATRGKNVLTGGIGADLLDGGYGNDVLRGGAGQDVFIFSTKLGKGTTPQNQNKRVNYDTIKDFKVGEDKIWLDNTVFKKLGKQGSTASPAKLNEKFFKIGKKAKDKNDYIVYNKKTGVISYDADGSGKKQKAVEIMKLPKGLALDAGDFFVI